MGELLRDRGRWRWRALCVFALLAGRGGVAAGEESAPPVQAFLTQHCVACHGAEKPKGKLRLDQLPLEPATAEQRAAWRKVLDRVAAGQMPPKAKPRPTEQEIKEFSDAIRARLAAGEFQPSDRGRVVLRRLNRTEYENTVSDLIGAEVKLRQLLPLDTSAGGFDNIGDALHTSSFLMERYLEAADTALDQAIANRPQPPLFKKRYSLQETHHVRSTTEKVLRKMPDGGVVLFSSSLWQAVGLSPFYPADRGDYRFRISASAIQSAGQPVVFGVWSGGGGMGGAKAHLVGYFDAPAEKPAVFEFVDRMEPRTSISILPYGLPNAQTVDKIGADAYEGPGLSIDWVEVEGPLHESWPPVSHRRIFGELAQRSAPIYNQSDRVEVTSENPAADAKRILLTFARRAFRRAVDDNDVKPYLTLFDSKLADGESFEQSLRVAFSAVLVAPEFLFLREPPGELDASALASRLAYFLWSSMPDDELLAIAEHHGEASLREPAVLRQQVERMLKHPKAENFTRNFVGQWLGLRDIDFTEPSHILYPEFDDMLRESMVRETELFFAEVLAHDLSLLNFVDSDFAMLNGRMARHYGIPGFVGWQFRKVQLPAESHRGGVLTMASVLRVTANGTSTSPVLRGAWVLDRILGTPPPKPPENVAALEPDTRGATTIREQLAKHRQIESCASCHEQIDPPGFALESFDVIGGWRDRYRSTGNGDAVMIDGRRMHYLAGPKVDPSGTLSDGRQFQNIDQFKQLLLADKDRIARALAVRLVTYATGAIPTEADQPQLDTIVAQVREQNYGFRSLVHAIVNSPLFREK